MTSTSSERGHRTVLRGLPAGSVASAHTDLDLRDGLWTRIGAGAVLGDAATEGTLLGLAESSRAAGRAQGFAAGWAEGLRASVARTAATQQAQDRVLEQHAATFLTAQRSALAAVETAARRCGEAAEEVRRDVAAATVELALQLAEAVIGRELAIASDPGADALRRALVATPVEVPVVVRLHPGDLTDLDRTSVGDRAVSFVADPTVARGDAVAETDTSVVDATVAASLARVREVLGA